MPRQEIHLRPKKVSDLANDFLWRCDVQLARFDARPPLCMPFCDFIGSYMQEMDDGHDSYRFAIETEEGKHIGNCMFFNWDRQIGSVEVGIVIGDKGCWSQGYGADALKALLKHIFTTMQVRRVCLHTLNWNIRAQRSFAKCGFVFSEFVLRDGHSFMKMEIPRGRWEPMYGEPKS